MLEQWRKNDDDDDDDNDNDDFDHMSNDIQQRRNTTPFPTNKGEPKISLAMQCNLKLIKTIQTNDTYNEPCLKCTRFSLF